jgi:hypothetical protein
MKRCFKDPEIGSKYFSPMESSPGGKSWSWLRLGYAVGGLVLPSPKDVTRGIGEARIKNQEDTAGQESGFPLKSIEGLCFPLSI